MQCPVLLSSLVVGLTDSQIIFRQDGSPQSQTPSTNTQEIADFCTIFCIIVTYYCCTDRRLQVKSNTCMIDSIFTFENSFQKRQPVSDTRRCYENLWILEASETSPATGRAEVTYCLFLLYKY